MVTAMLALLGLCMGSFISALTWRLHARFERKKPGKEMSIITGRSMCPQCRHRLGARDLVPIISWLSTGGKCRYCRKPISWQYPAIELLTALIFVVSYVAWPYGFGGQGIVMFARWLVVLTGLIALMVYDLRWMILPDRLVYPLTAFWALIVGFLYLRFDGSLTPYAGALVIAGLFWVLYQASGGRWIGGGDVKLGLLLGMLAGSPLEAFGLIFLASVLGLLAVLPALTTGRLKPTSRIPFGPFLIAAAVIIFLANDTLQQLIDAYIFPY